MSNQKLKYMQGDYDYYIYHKSYYGFFQTIDWMQILRCFVVGGLICIIGQILIDKTKLTPARILVTFVTVGVI